MFTNPRESNRCSLSCCFCGGAETRVRTPPADHYWAAAPSRRDSVKLQPKGNGKAGAKEAEIACLLQKRPQQWLTCSICHKMQCPVLSAVASALFLQLCPPLSHPQFPIFLSPPPSTLHSQLILMAFSHSLKQFAIMLLLRSDVVMSSPGAKDCDGQSCSSRLASLVGSLARWFGWFFAEAIFESEHKSQVILSGGRSAKNIKINMRHHGYCSILSMILQIQRCSLV